MHIHKFADLAVFDEVGVGGTLPATAEYRDFIKKLHPAQILTGRLTTPLLEVTYSYVTNRGNYKVAKKYLLLRSLHEDIDIEVDMELHDWVDAQNKAYPYRRISNVQILEINLIAYATISLVA
ncbi:MAG: hypothetical protein SOX46_13900 [Clostridiaceae bacterium]|nr:hypothetical protein [Clostridiaceae bacterium]